MKRAKILPADGLRKPQPYPGDMARIFNIRSDSKDWCSSPHRIAQFRYYQAENQDDGGKCRMLTSHFPNGSLRELDPTGLLTLIQTNN